MEEHDGIAEDQPAAAPPPQGLAGLLLRAISALVLGGLSLAAAWSGVLPFAALVLAVALLMSWEWAAVVRDGFDLSLLVQGAAVTGAVGLAAFGFAALGVAVLVIGTIIVLALEFGERPILSAAGVLYAGLPAVALIWLRSSEPLGFHAVVFIILVVAATDTAAFVFGRLIGGPRLAASISPNKTWSGLLGGVGAAGLTAAAYAYAIGAPQAALAVTGVLMGVIAQLGDLAESALKRAFHVKDASQLLPGHGGFMDRVDGLVPVAVVLALVVLFLDPQAPAEALLAGLPVARP